MRHSERENGESDEIEYEESRELEELKRDLRRFILEKRKEIAKAEVREEIEKHRARLQGIIEKNKEQDTGEKPPTPMRSSDKSDSERLNQRSLESERFSTKKERQKEEPRTRQECNESRGEEEKIREAEKARGLPEEKDESTREKRETKKPEPEETKNLKKGEAEKPRSREVGNVGREIKKDNGEEESRQKKFLHQQEGEKEGRIIQRRLNNFSERETEEEKVVERKKEDKEGESRGGKTFEQNEKPRLKAEDKKIEQRICPRETEGETFLETPEKEEKWLETLKYEKSTVLISGTNFSFTLSSEDVMSKVIEAKNKSQERGDSAVTQICEQTLREFKEEESVEASRLFTVARYLQENSGKAELPKEAAEIITDPYNSELKNVEEILQLVGAEYKKTPEGLYVHETLEPYENIEIPQEQIGEIGEKIKKTETLGTVEKLHDELEKLKAPIELDTLKSYLETGKGNMTKDAYLKICGIVGIEVNRNVTTRWRKLTENIAAGEWYNHSDILVRIYPEDLKALREELLSKMKEEGVNQEKFAAYLRDIGSIISRGAQIKNISKRRSTDTKALLAICSFLNRDPSTLREVDQNNIFKGSRVLLLPPRVARKIHLAGMRKYGQNYVSKLAKEIYYKPYMLTRYLSGEEKISLKATEEIHKALNIKIPDHLHARLEVKRSNFTREVVKEGKEGWEEMVEKLEVKKPEGGKKTLLTLTHTREEGGWGTYTEIKEIGKTFPPEITPWPLTSLSTLVTIDRTREFRDGKDVVTYIIDKCIENAGDAKNAMKILNISEETLEGLQNPERKKMRLKTLLIFTLYSGTNITELTDYIEKIGSIERERKPDLTIAYNTEDGARFVAGIQSDGWFSRRRKGYDIGFDSKERDFAELFADSVEGICGIHPRIREKEDGMKEVSVYSNLLGKSLERLGLIPEEKVEMNQGIPKPIKEGSLKIQKSYLDSYITSEANTVKDMTIQAAVNAPELEKYLETLSKIEGRKVKAKGKVIAKDIPIGKLEKLVEDKTISNHEDYKEIVTIAENKQINILQDLKELTSNIFEEHHISIKEKRNVDIDTLSVRIYIDNRITVIKQLELNTETTDTVHKILGGFQGYKEVMYADHVNVGIKIKSFHLNLTKEEVETLKNIGRYQPSNKIWRASVKKLPEELKRKCPTPPQKLLVQQREYSEKEVELLIKGTPIKVKGMPSRIRGEIEIDAKSNVTLFWKLVPGTVKEIKEKWESIKASHRKEIEEAKRKKKEEEEG